MKVFKNEQTYIIRIEKDEEVFDVLSRVAKIHDIQTAWIQGLGASKEVVLSFFDPVSKQYKDTPLSEPLEIAHLTGNLTTVDGEPFLHLHGVFGRENLETCSGHVKSLTVGVTLELLLISLNIPITRTKDTEMGLDFLSD